MLWLALGRALPQACLQSQFKILALMHSVRIAFAVHAAALVRSTVDGAQMTETLLLPVDIYHKLNGLFSAELAVTSTPAVCLF